MHKVEHPDYEQLSALCSHVNTFSETHSSVQSPYSEGNSDSPSILWNPEVHVKPQMIPILSQMNPEHPT
jgi:hypothetical protein